MQTACNAVPDKNAVCWWQCAVHANDNRYLIISLWSKCLVTTTNILFCFFRHIMLLCSWYYYHYKQWCIIYSSIYSTCQSMQLCIQTGFDYDSECTVCIFESVNKLCIYLLFFTTWEKLCVCLCFCASVCECACIPWDSLHLAMRSSQLSAWFLCPFQWWCGRCTRGCCRS